MEKVFVIHSLTIGWRRDLRVVLYGAGGHLDYLYPVISKIEEVTVIGIADSDNNKIGISVHGYIVRDLKKIGDTYDYIVITSTYEASIYSALISMGIDKNIILRWEQFLSIINGETEKHYIVSRRLDNEKSILALTPVLEFNGAALALFYLLEYLKRSFEYYITIVTSKEERDGFTERVKQEGFNVIVYPGLLFQDNCPFSNERYDFYIVNTLLTYRCLRWLDNGRTVWWLHEADIFYQIEKKRWDDFSDDIYTGFRTLCVSQDSEVTFKKYFSKSNTELFLYGLPDFYKQKEIFQNEKVVVAVVGAVSVRKGQDIFLDAIRQIVFDNRTIAEFWIIGKFYDNNFCRKIATEALSLDVKIIEDISHEELEKLYPQIDIIVSSSREDPLPIAVTEGLMNQKLCVIPDCIGTVSYVEHNTNARVYEANNSKALAETISYALNHKAEMKIIADNGRKVYLKYFAADMAAKRMNDILSFI